MTSEDHQKRFLASMKLEGIELSEKQLAMFDLFEHRGWDSEQCIRFVEEYYGYKNTAKASGPT